MNTTTDSVRIVLFAADDTSKFLILCEADDPTNWKLPGGKFNTSTETPREAVARELLEELGLAATEVTLREAGKLTNDDGVSARYIFAGVARIPMIKLSTEIAEHKWVAEADVPLGINRAHIFSAVMLARTSAKQ